MIALWFKNVKLLLQNINTSLYFSLKILNANWSVESSTSKSQQWCFCILIMTIDNSKLVNDLHVIIVVRIIFGLSKFFSNYHKWNECYPWTQSCSWKYTDLNFILAFWIWLFYCFHYNKTSCVAIILRFIFTLIRLPCHLPFENEFYFEANPEHKLTSKINFWTGL